MQVLEGLQRHHDFVQYDDALFGSHGPQFGQARHYDDDAKQYALQGKVVVEHAVYPTAVVLDEDQVIDIGNEGTYMDRMGTFDRILGFSWGGDVYHDYISLEYLAHAVRDAYAEGVCKHKMFQIGVADGYAPYVITKSMKVNCDVEWRGFCGDRYTDRLFGMGGRFRKQDVEAYCGRFSTAESVSLDEAGDALLETFKEKREDFLSRFGELLPHTLQGPVERI